MAASSLLRSSCAHHWLHSSQNGVFVISCTTRAAILACAEIQPSNKTVCGPGFLHHSSAKYPDTKASLATNSSVDDGYIGRQHARPMPRSLLALGRFALLDCFKAVEVRRGLSEKQRRGTFFPCDPSTFETCWDADRTLRRTVRLAIRGHLCGRPFFDDQPGDHRHKFCHICWTLNCLHQSLVEEAWQPRSQQQTPTSSTLSSALTDLLRPSLHDALARKGPNGAKIAP